VKVALDPASEPVHVQGDPGKLLQVMLNIILNGVQATAEGGTVHLATRPAQRSSVFDPKGPPVDHASIEIRDAGSGIPKELFERIFKPFFTTRAAGEGAGLGLAIANGIVKDYGGWIDVESEVGKGSRFTVYLPRGAR
jgi:signal transduction histidine kinase